MKKILYFIIIAISVVCCKKNEIATFDGTSWEAPAAENGAKYLLSFTDYSTATLQVTGEKDGDASVSSGTYIANENAVIFSRLKMYHEFHHEYGANIDAFIVDDAILAPDGKLTVNVHFDPEHYTSTLSYSIIFTKR